MQANCTGSYFWFYSAFFSPRMASSAFLTRLKRLCLDSRSNFLFASTERKNGAELYKKLKEKGVLVRHFDAPRIANWLRVTIGTPEEMQALLAALDKILEE